MLRRRYYSQYMDSDEIEHILHMQVGTAILWAAHCCCGLLPAWLPLLGWAQLRCGGGALNCFCRQHLAGPAPAQMSRCKPLACFAGCALTLPAVPLLRLVQWRPLHQGSPYLEDYYYQVRLPFGLAGSTYLLPTCGFAVTACVGCGWLLAECTAVRQTVRSA